MPVLCIVQLEDEIKKMVSLEGMKRKEHVLELARLMVRSDNSKQRLSLLTVLQVRNLSCSASPVPASCPDALIIVSEH